MPILTIKNNNGDKLKQYHHIQLDTEFISDCKMWLTFLDNKIENINRPFDDIERMENSQTLRFYSNASGVVGMGAIYNDNWMVMEWNKEIFIKRFNPSIEFLELFALVAVVLA